MAGRRAGHGVAGRPGPVAIVTDSAACPPPGRTWPGRVTVVPLRLVAGGQSADDAADGVPPEVAARLSQGQRLMTSRPPPAAFAAAYRQAAARGAAAIVSVHMSGSLSGTIAAAELAAADASIPVYIVDTRSIGVGEGLAVLAAVSAAAAGRPAADVSRAARHRAASVGSFFALDSAGPLLAGGRLADRPAPLLICRPVLAISEGEVTVADRVRTRTAAAHRLAELAAGFAAGRPVAVAVQHTCGRERADALLGELMTAIPGARPLGVIAAGAAIAAHTGPGMVGAVVAPGPGD